MTDAPLEEGTPLPDHEEFVKSQEGNPDFVNVVQEIVDDVAQVVSTPTVNTPAPPSVFFDAQGVPHVVIPLTKKTKAIIGTLAATVSTLGTSSALLFLPENVRLWAAGATFIAGGILTWLGIAQPTNLPVRSDKV